MSVTQTRAENAAGTSCWSCKAATNSAQFCPACGKIQPLPRDTSYFALFGLREKLGIDGDALEQRFHKLSWKLHPDNFVRADEFERNLSLECSSELNDAYRTLSDPLTRVEYLLEEVFELNESLDELREARESGEGVTELRGPLESAQKDFQSKLADVDGEL